MSFVDQKGIVQIGDLMKALNAQGYDQSPSSLVQTGALQTEDLSNNLYLLTVKESQLNLQKMLGAPQKAKSLTYQFNRQNSIGQIGSSAVLEGQIGEETTSNYVRVTVPMAFYSHTRSITLQASLLQTFDGVALEEKQAKDAALKIAIDTEMDLYRGRELFSNAGIFDGNPNAMPVKIANMVGLDAQIRQSDSLDANAVDLNFVEWGQGDSIVIPANGTLTQDIVENATLALNLQFGRLEEAQGILDPIALSAYNKLSFGVNRFVLGNDSAVTRSGTRLNSQFVSAGEISFTPSQFLRGKTNVPPQQVSSPNAPQAPSIASTAQAAGTTTFALGEKYFYFATAVNERGESRASAATSQQTISAAGNSLSLTINPSGSGQPTRWFNVYRTNNNGLAATAKFIGRVAANGASAVFVDLNKRSPAASAAYILSKGTMEVREMMGYTRLKLAVVQASQTEAHMRFMGLAVMAPKQNIIIDNLARSI